MATATDPTAPRTLEASRQKVRSPLAQLRGYIRSYVSLEGASLCGLYLALWFWIGMVLDYGVFRLLYVDWVQVLPWGLRLGTLILLSSGLLATAIFVFSTRLLREFREASLALVLERRFPKLLGDRLITAVELSDPRQAAELGYSEAMVRETIHEAAERVAQVPLREVFDWKRLWRRGLLVALLSVGLYLLCWGGVRAVRALTSGPRSPLGSWGLLNQVSSLWVQRNILLRNREWPRRTHFEVVNFPPDLRVPKDTAPPQLRVRAWKYMIAEGSTPAGWRLLKWEDVTQREGLFGGPVAAPPDWKPRDPKQGLTADEVELWLARFPVSKGAAGEDGVPAWRLKVDEESSRDLRWADLTKDRLGDFRVPELSPGEWDPKALPALGASVVALQAGASRPLAALTRAWVGPKSWGLTVQVVQQQLPAREAAVKRLAEQGKAERDKLLKALAAREPGAGALLKDKRQAAAVNQKVGEALAQWAAEPDGRELRGKVEEALEEAKAPPGTLKAFAVLWEDERAKAAEAAFRDVRRQSEQAGGARSVLDRLERYVQLREVMDAVVARMGEAEHARLLRRLEMPDTLELLYRGGRTDSSSTMMRANDNEYTGTFNKLKETVRFRARGGDYSTPWQTIDVVEHPRIEQLESEEDRPAYVYYRLKDGKPGELRGKRQSFAKVLLSVSGADASTAEVLAGTTVRLTARTNKPLKWATLSTLLKVGGDKKQEVTLWGWARPLGSAKLEGLKGEEVAGVQLRKVSDDKHAVQLRLDDAGVDRRFVLRYTDSAGSPGRSEVSLVAVRDAQKKVTGVQATYELEVMEDEKSFAVQLEAVRQELGFTVAFRDTDDVDGNRPIKVVPKVDRAPSVRQFKVDDAIRKTPLLKEGRPSDSKDPKDYETVYVVTARARLPFKAEVRDDLGLSTVRYGYTVLRQGALPVRREEETVARMGGAFVPALPGPGGLWSAAVTLGAPLEERTSESYAAIPAFDNLQSTRRLDDGRPEALTRETIFGLLPQKQSGTFRSLLKAFNLEPDDWTQGEPLDDAKKWYRTNARPADNDLLVRRLRWQDPEDGRLKELEERRPGKDQARFRVQAWLEAEDTYLEGERGPDGQPRPHRSRSGETFTFVVVSEDELRSKIAVEEEAKRGELRRAWARLDERQKDRVTKSAQDRPSATEIVAEMVKGLAARGLDEDAVASMAVRAGTLDLEEVAASQKDARGVLGAYQRILREFRLNECDPDHTAKIYNMIVKPLGEICDDRGGNFDRTRVALQALQKELENKKQPLPARVAEAEKKALVVQQELQQLVSKLNEVLEAMEGITTLNDVIALAVKIKRRQEEEAERIRKFRAQAIKELLGGK
jgi:hypothetical protein